MTQPTTRAEFSEFCLRKLGKPVLEINVDDDQVSDRIDESIRFFWDYHFDGSDKVYYKYQIRDQDMQGRISEVQVVSGGTGYANGAAVTFTANNNNGNGATATVTTNASGSITSVNIVTAGQNYHLEPTVTVASGTGAVFKPYLGGYITLPDNIIGAVRIFSPGDPSLRSDDMFSIRYQIVLNDLYTLTSYSLVPYYMTMQQLSLMQEILIGQKPIRYNRHKNRLYIDTQWSGQFSVGEFLIVEAYEVVDPNVYSDAWADRWLQEFATQKIKQQWGTNMKKFTGLQLPGGVGFSGQAIYDEATAKLEQMESEAIDRYSLPVLDMVG